MLPTLRKPFNCNKISAREYAHSIMTIICEISRPNPSFYFSSNPAARNSQLITNRPHDRPCAGWLALISVPIGSPFANKKGLLFLPPESLHQLNDSRRLDSIDMPNIIAVPRGDDRRKNLTFLLLLFPLLVTSARTQIDACKSESRG